jgi:acyl-homoserine-lactone acylase
MASSARRALGAATAGLLAVLALTPAAALSAAGPRATIQRTAYGVPHILATSWQGLGYGYGYALAQDNFCVLADTYMTVSGERSRYLGPDGSYKFRGNSTEPNNLNSDFFYQRIIDARTIEKLLAEPPPLGPEPQVRQTVRGYVEGYNRYLADTGVDKIPDPTCRSKPWVRPITEIDAYRRFYSLALLASGGVAIDGIGSAQPPGPSLLPAAAASSPSPARVRSEFLELGDRLHTIGSNAVGLGRDATTDGRGMVLGNPHFPWEGSERLYQSHLTIPGKIDVEGASLLGVPIVLIGTTRTLAWSHTVSTAFRFTPFELKLVPGSPTSYLYDGKIRQMVGQKVTVQALVGGKLEARTRTLYSSLQGPILTSILGLPLFPWTPATAYAMGDANADNFRYLNHFFEVDRAKSVHQLYDIQRRTQGIPWVTTVGADSTGEAYFGDLGVVPNVPDAKTAACPTALGLVSNRLLGLPVLDGSRSACAWDNDPDSLQPGTFGPSKEPHLFRSDYVTNSNDSAWLANPAERLEGYPRIIGDQRTARSLRTRLGLIMVKSRIDGTDGLPGKGFTLGALQNMVFNDRQYAAELFGDQLIAYCKDHPELAGTGGGVVDVSAACPVLEHWDRTDNLDSRGALLFRRFATHLLDVSGTAVDSSLSASAFKTPFSVADPVNTPRGLNTASPTVGIALADAVSDLKASGIPLDARLRDYQYRTVPGAGRIPIHGGPGTLGVFNAINVSFTKGKGYPEPPHGSSFVMAAHLTPGCPTARMIVTYSESANPDSPHYSDMTRLFSRKVWPKVRFCEPDVLADPALRITQLNGGSGRMRVAALPGVVRASAARRRLRVLVTFGTARSWTPVGGATVRLAGRVARTDRHGRATLGVTLRHRGRSVVVVTRRALGRTLGSVRVR